MLNSDDVFDLLEEMKAVVPAMAGCFSRSTGGIDLPAIIAVIRLFATSDAHPLPAAA